MLHRFLGSKAGKLSEPFAFREIPEGRISNMQFHEARVCRIGATSRFATGLALDGATSLENAGTQIEALLAA